MDNLNLSDSPFGPVVFWIAWGGRPQDGVVAGSRKVKEGWSGWGATSEVSRGFEDDDFDLESLDRG